MASSRVVSGATGSGRTRSGRAATTLPDCVGRSARCSCRPRRPHRRPVRRSPPPGPRSGPGRAHPVPAGRRRRAGEKLVGAAAAWKRCRRPTRAALRAAEAGSRSPVVTRVSKAASQRSCSSGSSSSHSRRPMPIDPCERPVLPGVAPRLRAAHRVPVGRATGDDERHVGEVGGGDGHVGQVDGHDLGDAVGDGLRELLASSPTSTRRRPVRAASSILPDGRPAGAGPLPSG